MTAGLADVFVVQDERLQPHPSVSPPDGVGQSAFRAGYLKRPVASQAGRLQSAAEPKATRLRANS